MTAIIKTLKTATDTITIDNSGFIREWKSQGKSILIPYHEMTENKKLVRRGGSFICFPFFGETPETYPNLPRHGFLRDMEFSIKTVKNTNHDQLAILIPWKYPTKTNFPYPLSIEVLIELGMTPGKFKQGLRVVNLGSEPIPINPAFHPYFFLPKGNGTVSIAGRTFHIQHGKYEGLRDSLQNSATLNFHGQHITYTTAEGEISIKVCSNFNRRHGQIVLWSDNPKKYLCVEPVVHEPKLLGTKKGLWLKPGLKNVMEFSCTYSYKESRR